MFLENIWIQKRPPGSGLPDTQIVGMDTNDPVSVFKERATPDHLWAKFREYAIEAFEIDFSGPLPPPNENIVNWREQMKI